MRALRHALERGRFSPDDAVALCLVQLGRAGGPASRIPAAKRDALVETLQRLARGIDPSQPRTILAFARAASAAVWGTVHDGRHPGARITEIANDASPRTLARAAVFATLTSARNADDHVQRAVTRALRERGRARGRRRLPLSDDDPLRAVLDVPRHGKVLLPKTDVRGKIAHAAAGTPFGEALRQAARFSEELIRPALGEELWALARPVAFSDKQETRVIVEVRSPLAAHEVQLRSQELVHRLRDVPTFERVAGIKLVVVEAKVLRVTPRR